MKHTLLTLLAMAAMAATGTVSAETPLKVYCKITEETVNQKTSNIYLDYGQERRKAKSLRIKDNDGDIAAFNSMVEALNIMSALGWELEQAYTEVVGIYQSSIFSTTHYLLSKEVEDMDELKRLPEDIVAKGAEFDVQ